MKYGAGGLLIDFELLKPKIPSLLESFSLPVPSSPSSYPTLLEIPPLDPSHSAVVEMRAVTIIMLDRLADGIRKKLGVELTLPQVLEAGTWKAVSSEPCLSLNLLGSRAALPEPFADDLVFERRAVKLRRSYDRRREVLHSLT